MVISVSMSAIFFCISWFLASGTPNWILIQDREMETNVFNTSEQSPRPESVSELHWRFYAYSCHVFDVLWPWDYITLIQLKEYVVPVQSVLAGSVETEFSCSQSSPCNSIAGVIQTAERTLLKVSTTKIRLGKTKN